MNTDNKLKTKYVASDEEIMCNIHVADPERGLEGLKDLTVKVERYKLDYPFHHSDTLARGFLNLPREGGWLKRARTALFLSAQAVAERLGMSRSNYARFEQNENRMKIANLRKCAEAMDCELVYAIVPKERTPYSERVWRRLQDCGAPNLFWLRIRQYFPPYRRQHGWRKNYRSVDTETRQHYWAWRTGRTVSEATLPARRKKH